MSVSYRRSAKASQRLKRSINRPSPRVRDSYPNNTKGRKKALFKMIGSNDIMPSRVDKVE